jgi:hypothetical protein
VAVSRPTARGIEISIRLTPRAGRDSLGGVSLQADGREYVQAWVRAVPADGEANAALVALVAKQLKVPKSAVSIRAGAGQRLKRIEIIGDADELTARLAAIVANRSQR